MSSELIFLIDLAARSALILAIAWATVLAAPKLSAAARYWIWLTALCTLPLLLLTASFPAKTIIEIGPKTSPIELEKTTPLATSVVVETTAPTSIDTEAPRAMIGETSASTEAGPAPRLRTPPEHWFPSPLLLAYVLGVAGSLLPLLAGLLRLRTLRRSATAVDNPVAGVELPARTKLFSSSRISIPLTWGTLRPVVVLPKSSASWTRERLGVVLAHESAHITRHDFATGILASLLRAAFWFQPLAWFAHRQLRVEREIACDDRVLQAQASTAPDYAEHLSEVVKAAGRQPQSVAIAMARPSEIVERVRAILDSARNRAALSPSAKRRITLLALVLFAPLAFVRCAGEKSEAGGRHETSIGIKLSPVNPAAVTLTKDGEKIEIPGGGPFSMSETEVTQSQFQQLLGHNPSLTKAAHLPVDQVTRTEAAMFCKVLTERDRAAGILPKGKVYRLPTQREWVLAAFPGGLIPVEESLDAIAWHKGNSASLMHPVGAKEANAYGLYDLIGNAAEWSDPDEELNAALESGAATFYRAKTVLQIRPPELDGTLGDSMATLRNTYMQTQFQIIASKSVILPCARELDLKTRWSLGSDAEAADRLASHLKVKNIRGTDLVEISYVAEDEEFAANVANQIAHSYRELIRNRSHDTAKMVISTLEIELQRQAARLEEARAAMLKLMKESGIVTLDNNQPKWLGEANAGLVAERTKSDALQQLRATLEQVEKLEGEELIRAGAELGIGNQVFKARYPEYESAVLNEAALAASGIGTAHPKRVQANNMIAALEKLLVETLQSSKRSLQTKIRVAEEDLANAAKKKEEAEEESRSEAEWKLEYVAARDEYELQKKLLAELKERIALAQLENRLPRHSVAIHEKALARKTSSTPKENQPIAIGGTAFQDPQDLLDSNSAAGIDERSPGVGFRFVMAEE